MGLKVFDTNIVIYALDGDISLDLSFSEIAISVITKIELLAYRGGSDEYLALVATFIEAAQVLPLSDVIADKTVELRRETRLKLPDAIIAATAIAYDADLLSNDIAFQEIPGLRVVTPKGTLPPT